VFSLRRWLAALRPPSDPYSLAVAKLERGDPAEALAMFTAILHDAPSDALRARVYNKRGIAHVRLGRRDDARRDFDEALAIDPRFAPALTNIGNMLLEEDRVDEAIAQYRSALAADDGYAFAHLNLAVAYRRSGKRLDAVREMRLANRLEARRRRLPLERRE
jgi:tetratricopeptide (TPR) repeat protein